MTTVKPFDRSVIETYLLEQDLNYLKDRDGDFQVKFNYDEDCGCALTVWFVLNNSIYGFIVLNENIDLQQGIHQELFDDWTGTVISVGFGFWKWVQEQQGV